MNKSPFLTLAALSVVIMLATGCSSEEQPKQDIQATVDAAVAKAVEKLKTPTNEIPTTKAKAVEKLKTPTNEIPTTKTTTTAKSPTPVGSEPTPTSTNNTGDRKYPTPTINPAPTQPPKSPSKSSAGEKSNSQSDKPVSNSWDRMFLNREGKTGVYRCTEDNTRAFTYPIVKPATLTDMEPMGKMASSHVTPTDHLYVHWSQPAAGVTEYVMAPADGQIVEIGRFPRDSSPRFDPSITVPDYRMVIMHSCAFFTIFIHLGELAPEIMEQTGPIPLGTQWFSSRSGPIEIKAGDPLSKTNGSDGLDWSVHDAEIRLPGFIKPDHYIGEPWKIHTVDPFQYYKEPLRSQLLSTVVRKAEPRAGKIDYDVEGKIVGNWFLEGTNDYRGNTNDSAYWKGHLTLAYGYIDPTQIRISLGFDSGIDDQQLCNVCFGAYGVRDNKPDPASIGPDDGLVKYELMSRQGPNHEQVGDTSLGTFLVQHLGNRTLKVEFLLGKTPDQVAEFSADAKIYKR